MAEVLDRKEMDGMTVVKLRELALEKYPEIQGVSGMKKEELIETIITEEIHLGLRPKEVARTAGAAGMGITELKARVRALKGERHQALEAADSAALVRVRAEIKRMKRRLRKIREAAPAA